MLLEFEVVKVVDCGRDHLVIKQGSLVPYPT